MASSPGSSWVIPTSWTPAGSAGSGAPSGSRPGTDTAGQPVRLNGQREQRGLHRHGRPVHVDRGPADRGGPQPGGGQHQHVDAVDRRAQRRTEPATGALGLDVALSRQLGGPQQPVVGERLVVLVGGWPATRVRRRPRRRRSGGSWRASLPIIGVRSSTILAPASVPTAAWTASSITGSAAAQYASVGTPTPEPGNPVSRWWRVHPGQHALPAAGSPHRR